MLGTKSKCRMRYISICLIFVFLLSACSQMKRQEYVKENEQTQVENAQFIIDKDGVPIMNIEKIGKVRHPAWIGIYALQYADAESFYDLVVDEDKERFANCISWIKRNYKTTAEGYTVWMYDFDSTYNDVTIEKPWYSAFGQALPIEALVEYYNQYGDQEALELAQAAAEILFVDISEGGLLFQDGENYWFEEIPTLENPSHILNGHMRTLIALDKLYQASQNEQYRNWFEKGAITLSKWLPQYDTGYWLRYDLNPKKEELLFRFNNKYGHGLFELPVDEIMLTDPVSQESITIDVGSQQDAEEGKPRIAGNGWGEIQELDGRSVRRLVDVTEDVTVDQHDGGFHAPYTYFYLDLPVKWIDNLRTEWFEMTVVYKDETAGNINVQTRSIAPGDAFVDLKDGGMLMTGSGEWREWKIPVRTTDLGWWTGEVYAEKHMLYLAYLAEIMPELEPWSETSRMYLNSIIIPDDYETVIVEKKELPKQSLLVPVYSLDETGVLRYHLASENTEFNEKGEWLAPSVAGEPIYNPYIVACQALQGGSYLTAGYLYDIRQAKGTFDYWDSYDWIYPDALDRIKKEPAFAWLNSNKTVIKDAYTWYYDFESCYNDVIQEKGWQSAFSQRYIIDAYMSIDDKESALKAAYAYQYATEDGGLSSFNQDAEMWFEEVPNNTHILNAHIASLVALKKVYTAYQDETVKELYEKGLKSLQENLYRFDTGYWSKYDMNPKKELLFQLDWGKGEESPFISEIQLYNPASNTATKLDVGSSEAFDSYPNIAGAEWAASDSKDGVLGRQFENGYVNRLEAVSGGTRHNVYFNAVLPEQEFGDYFNLPPHQLMIRYKDVAEGEFTVKIQSINEGNSLVFTEIPDGVIHCIGDNEWKTAVIHIRPNDMGWFMGEDYQVYHNEQLGIVAEQSGNWLIKQYLEKWNYYLHAYQRGETAIISGADNGEKTDISGQMHLIDASSAYEGFGMENSLDQDPYDDYTAFLETDQEQSFTLGFEKTVNLCEIQLWFESKDNFAEDYDIIFFEGGKEVSRINVADQESEQQTVVFEPVKVDRFQVKANSLKGQQRLLLRQIKAFEISSGIGEDLKGTQDSSPEVEGMKVSSASADIDVGNLETLLYEGGESVKLFPDSWFVLEFHGEVRMDRLRLEFEEGPESLLLYSTDMAGAVNYDTIYENSLEGLSGLSIETDKTASYLCVKVPASDRFQDGEIKLKDIKVYGWKNYPSSLEDSDIYLDAKDEKNPMKIWKKPITRGLLAYSEELLDGRKDLTEHEKIMIFMDSMRSFKVGLAAVQGMEGRVITLDNYPEGMGHVVAEIKVDGHWSVYDPTYGAYYTTTPEDEKTPYVLSFEELRRGDGKHVDVTRVVTVPERLISDAAYDFLGPDIYERADPAGLVDVTNKLFYPLTIDFAGKREITKDEYATTYQGASYIGAAGKNQSQIWTIKNLEPEKEYVLCVDVSYVGGEKSQEDFIAYARVENGRILSGEKKTFNNNVRDFKWRVRFTAKDKTVKITLTHDYVGPEYHHVYIEKIAVEEIRE